MKHSFLLHLDPLDESDPMISTRVPIYDRLARHLVQAGHRCRVYGRKKYLAHLAVSRQRNYELTFCRIPTVKFNPPHKYHSLAYANNLPQDICQMLYSEYREYLEYPTIIITNTPSAGLRLVWPKLLILHYELGVFNRPPLPVFHQIDPWGYYHKSILSAFPLLNFKTNDAQTSGLLALREKILRDLNLTSHAIGSRQSLYLPMQSADTWPVRIENTHTDRLSLIEHVVSLFPGTKICINEKPQSPLTGAERLGLQNFKDVELIENDDIMGTGWRLAMESAETFTSSASLALQAIFWGNRLHVPTGSSMQAWACHGSLEKLASYISYFNFRTPDGFLARVDFLNRIWRSRPGNFQQTSFL